MADQLGFAPRTRDDRGLSILIMGSEANMEKLRLGVERHWWPRLLDGRLDVSFLVDGEELSRLDPRSTPSLRRFVRAWDVAKRSITPGPRDQVKDLSHKKTKFGAFSITTGGEDEEEEFGDPQAAPRSVEIALVRNPGMVVEYLSGPPLSSIQPTCGAVFLADPDMNAVLAKSEPPAHNQWDYRTIRRDRPLTDEERQQIENTIVRIKRAARSFVQTKEAPPAKPPARCREMEKALGRWIGIGPEPTPPPPPPPDPFQIRFLVEPERVSTDNRIALDAKIQVGLRDEEELEPENLVRVRAWVDTILDDGTAAPKQERLQMSYLAAKGPDGEESIGESDDLGSYVDLVLKPGGPSHTVDLRSNALPHSEYRASLSISCEVLP